MADFRSRAAQHLHEHDELRESLHRLQHQTVKREAISALSLSFPEKGKELLLAEASLPDRFHGKREVVDEITITFQNHFLRKLPKQRITRNTLYGVAT